MSLSLTLATILGPLFLVVAIGLLVNPGAYRDMIGDLQKSTASWYFGGLFALVFGLLIVQWHNVWAWQWPVVITLLGWAALIKGVVLLVFPKWIIRWAEFYQHKPMALRANAVFALILGLFLTIMGLTG